MVFVDALSGCRENWLYRKQKFDYTDCACNREVAGLHDVDPCKRRAQRIRCSNLKGRSMEIANRHSIAKALRNLTIAGLEPSTRRLLAKN